ncbi:MAG: hypothetical protein ACXW4C_09400 [Nitrospira sp.]
MATISLRPPATVLETSDERQPSGWYDWYEQNGCFGAVMKGFD